MEISLYLAGPLFNAAERFHNSRLESELIRNAKKRGIILSVTSPQRTALRRFISPEKGFDVAGIVDDCVHDSANHDVILCNLDGPDSDSGTSAEYGIALGQRVAHQRLLDAGLGSELKVPRIITYRTDFRTNPEKEIGFNAMLKAQGTIHIYHPCFAVELTQFDQFYRELASKIVSAINREVH